MKNSFRRIQKYKLILDCKIRQIQFVINDQGRSTGECFVILESRDDIDRAKTFDKKKMGNRKYKFHLLLTYTMMMMMITFSFHFDQAISKYLNRIMIQCRI